MKTKTVRAIMESQELAQVLARHVLARRGITLPPQQTATVTLIHTLNQSQNQILQTRVEVGFEENDEG